MKSVITHAVSSNFDNGAPSTVALSVPVVVERTSSGERAYDIFSRLHKDRIVMLSGAINDEVAHVIIAQLLQLESEDPESDISLYVNSPGGVVTAGMAIVDTMKLIKPDVATICIGQCASMGAVILSAGAPGKRHALPHSRIMIHQPLGGCQGQASDIRVQAEEMLRTKTMLITELADNCQQPFEKVEADCERDYFLDPDAAIAYGLIDLKLARR